MELPNKKYQIIYVDPPWYYNDKLKFKQKNEYNSYNKMRIKDICDMPVQQIADKNCALFLWSTLPQLPDAFKVIKSWGFEYKTTAFVWVKKNKKKEGWFWGLGYYTRSNAEICLLAIKGKMKKHSWKVHQIICEPPRKLPGHN